MRRCEKKHGIKKLPISKRNQSLSSEGAESLDGDQSSFHIFPGVIHLKRPRGMIE